MIEKSTLVVTLPILLGCFALAAINLLKRYIMKIGSVSPLQFLVIWYFSISLSYGAIIIAVWKMNSPTLLTGFWNAVAGTVFANIFIQFFNAKAASLDKGEVSFTAPLQALTPGMITLLAITLREFPSVIGSLGILLMTSGSYILLWGKTPDRWWKYFGPLKRIILLTKLGGLSPEERDKTIVVSLALGSACMGTVGLLFDGLLMRRGVNLHGLFIGSMVQALALGSIYAVWFWFRPDNGIRKPEAAAEKKYTHISLFFYFVGIIAAWIIAVWLVNPAFNKTLVAYVGTLKRFSIIASVVFGWIFFGETEFKKRLWAAVLIVLGALFISLDDLPARIATKIEGIGI